MKQNPRSNFKAKVRARRRMVNYRKTHFLWTHPGIKEIPPGWKSAGMTKFKFQVQSTD